MNNQTKDKWDRHYDSCSFDTPLAAVVLRENQHLLPSQGEALDLACGRGGNALCLAENGLQVSAWDISESALKHLSLAAQKNNLTINTESRDVSERPPAPASFDVIVVSHFLERAQIDNIKTAIRHKGLIFYQTFIKDKVAETGPKNPDYLLDPNELLYFFNNWRILHYREEGKVGLLDKGFRNQAMIIAQKL